MLFRDYLLEILGREPRPQVWTKKLSSVVKEKKEDRVKNWKGMGQIFQWWNQMTEDLMDEVLHGKKSDREVAAGSW
jgi:hypothetical protein